MHKNFRENKFDWAAVFPDVGFYSDDHMDIMKFLPIIIGKVYIKMEMANHRATKSKYRLIPLVVNSSKFEIGCLNAESHNERMIFCHK